MKIHHCSRFFLLLALLFLSGYVPCLAASDEVRSQRAILVTPEYKGGSAHLIIRRTPNLGKFLTTSLWIDGNPVGGIPYGGSYNGFLSPGRHILSTLGVPYPAWAMPWQTTVDVRSGHTYVFTAMGDHAGHVILVSRPE
jgi:hypothetical protein